MSRTDARPRSFVSDEGVVVRGPVLSHVRSNIGLFAENEVARLNIPEGYQRSITAWFVRSAPRLRDEGWAGR